MIIIFIFNDGAIVSRFIHLKPTFPPLYFVRLDVLILVTRTCQKQQTSNTINLQNRNEVFPQKVWTKTMPRRL